MPRNDQYTLGALYLEPIPIRRRPKRLNNKPVKRKTKSGYELAYKCPYCTLHIGKNKNHVRLHIIRCKKLLQSTSMQTKILTEQLTSLNSDEKTEILFNSKFNWRNTELYTDDAFKNDVMSFRFLSQYTQLKFQTRLINDLLDEN
jgi:hypothetical protein